jgi:hypothetical protein
MLTINSMILMGTYDPKSESPSGVILGVLHLFHNMVLHFLWGIIQLHLPAYWVP